MNTKLLKANNMRVLIHKLNLKIYIFMIVTCRSASWPLLAVNNITATGSCTDNTETIRETFP